MDWEPEQLNLGALGFAGICRETYRVLFRAILPNTKPKGGWGAAILSSLLLPHIAGYRAILDHANDRPDQVGLIAGVFAYMLLSMLVLLLLSFFSTTAYVFRVAILYCTDGDSGASDRILRDLPRAPLARLVCMFAHVVPLALWYMTLCNLAWSVLLHIQATPSNEVVVLAVKVLGASACLASAAYVAVVSHISCVVAALEDGDAGRAYVTFLLGAVRKSRALLVGKFWAAAAVFVPLDVCFVALQVLFLKLVLEDALGLGRGFQVAAGAAMAVALWAVVVVTLVAQPVVYLVCKNHHHEVVDKVHLNYVGEYQPLDVDGVELQPVKTEQIPETSQCPAGQSLLLPST